MAEQGFRFGVVDGAGRTHLVDPDDFNEMPVCGYLGDVSERAVVAYEAYVCIDCGALAAGQPRPRHRGEGLL